MTFAQRQIDLQFSSSKGTVKLPGIRCAAIVNCLGGSLGMAQMALRIYGLPMSVMNQYSFAGMQWSLQQKATVTLSAGDMGSAARLSFTGDVNRSYIDFSRAPDVCFCVSAISGLYDKAAPSAPNSYPGAQNAEDMIRSIASSIGYAFVNANGAHAILQNQYVYGSAIKQILTIADAAVFGRAIEHNTVTIWPNDGARDDTVIDISPGNGLVGYPSYWEAGFTVKSEFNPRIATGRKVNLTGSVITQANGNWPIQTVTHELGTMSPDAPWFTTAQLSPSEFCHRN